MVAKELTGQRFGRLVVIERIGSRCGNALWKCRCNCGNIFETITSCLLSGSTKSCGCLKNDVIKEVHTTHGMTHARIYHTWQGMHQRCNNSKLIGYKNYGGRGICVCKEWSEFIPFYNWAMKNGYNEALTIDRIDNSKGYSPFNCKFSTVKEQSNNRRSNVWYEYKGEKKSMTQWSDIYGMPYHRLLCRLRNGWTIEKSLNTPVKTPIRIKKII